MTLSLLDANGIPPGSWQYEITPEDMQRNWYPSIERINQLRENTRCTGYRHHINVGDYPIINGIWACARATGPYRGKFPGGYMERFETLMYVFHLVDNFDPHSTMMLFPFGGSVVKRPNIHTIDINPDVDPTYEGNVTDIELAAKIPNNHYDIVKIDPPYDTDDREYARKLYGTEPVKPYSFVSNYADGREGRTNLARKVKIGGIVAILHQLVYKNIPLCERIGVIGITTGPNMRIRVLNLFIRTERESRKRIDEIL